MKIRAEINEIETEINETKSQFFEKINKVNKPLGKERWPKSEMQKKVQQTSQKLKRIISDYYEQLIIYQ